MSQLEKSKRGGNNDLAVEMMRAREMYRSLRKKELLEGKLSRVERRLDKARRALARKTLKKTRETIEYEEKKRLQGSNLGTAASGFGTALELRTESLDTGRLKYLAENGGLASWRKPYLEDYTFNSPVVHSLLSHGLHPKHRFETEKHRSSQYMQIGDSDAKKLKQLAHISDGGHHGVVKSDFVSYAEERIIFDRMMKPPPVRARIGSSS